MLALPIVLLGIHFSPGGFRESLVFSPAAPDLVSAFGAHFVHRSVPHLLGNLVVYALIVPSAYVLAVLGRCRQQFLQASAVVVLVFPFVLSGLHLLLMDRGMVLGFSGLAFAFVGVLPLLLPGYLARFEGEVRVAHMPVIFFAGVSVIAIRSLPAGQVRFAVTLGAALVAIGYAAALWRDLRTVRLGALVQRAGTFELALGAPILFFLAILAGFPTDPGRDAAIVNLYGHVIGYGLGFITAFVIFHLDDTEPSPIGRPPEANA